MEIKDITYTISGEQMKIIVDYLLSRPAFETFEILKMVDSFPHTIKKEGEGVPDATPEHLKN